MPRKYSLKTESYLLSGIMIIFIIILSGIIYSTIFYSYKRVRNHIYENESKLIEELLNEDINYLSHYMKFIGEKIVNSKDTSADYIASLISNKLPNNILNNDFSSWTLFDWVDDNKF